MASSNLTASSFFDPRMRWPSTLKTAIFSWSNSDTFLPCSRPHVEWLSRDAGTSCRGRRMGNDGVRYEETGPSMLAHLPPVGCLGGIETAPDWLQGTTTSVCRDDIARVREPSQHSADSWQSQRLVLSETFVGASPHVCGSTWAKDGSRQSKPIATNKVASVPAGLGGPSAETRVDSNYFSVGGKLLIIQG